MQALWIIVSITTLCMLAGLFGVTLRMRALRFESRALKARLELVSSDLNALCSGAVGVDRRVSTLENQGRSLDQRQESLENQKQDERPYGEAIQMVHKGASAGNLIDKLGLSRSEAELVVMLHGVRKAS
ncbi:MAG: DUF2802 domain-containing protein [Gammaproteobacteria bacterium]|nr:DUF2802 domain-containing protein [Gammaproteobacteria bacterium]